MAPITPSRQQNGGRIVFRQSTPRSESEGIRPNAHQPQTPAFQPQGQVEPQQTRLSGRTTPGSGSRRLFKFKSPTPPGGDNEEADLRGGYSEDERQLQEEQASYAVKPIGANNTDFEGDTPVEDVEERVEVQDFAYTRQHRVADKNKHETQSLKATTFTVRLRQSSVVPQPAPATPNRGPSKLKNSNLQRDDTPSTVVLEPNHKPRKSVHFALPATPSPPNKSYSPTLATVSPASDHAFATDSSGRKLTKSELRRGSPAEGLFSRFATHGFGTDSEVNAHYYNYTQSRHITGNPYAALLSAGRDLTDEEFKRLSAINEARRLELRYLSLPTEERIAQKARALNLNLNLNLGKGVEKKRCGEDEMAEPRALNHALLRPAILHILRAAGYHATKPSVLDTLTDIAGRYLSLLASLTAENARTAGNSADIGLTDVRLAMSLLGQFSPEALPETELSMGHEDTRGIENWLAWVQGPENKEIRRVALEGGESGEDFLTGLKKKGEHAVAAQGKDGTESRYAGTVLGPEGPGHQVVIEGWEVDSFGKWNEYLRTKAGVSSGKSSRRESKQSGQSSELSELDDMDVDSAGKKDSAMEGMD